MHTCDCHPSERGLNRAGVALVSLVVVSSKTGKAAQSNMSAILCQQTLDGTAEARAGTPDGLGNLLYVVEGAGPGLQTDGHEFYLPADYVRRHMSEAADVFRHGPELLQHSAKGWVVVRWADKYLPKPRGPKQ